MSLDKLIRGFEHLAKIIESTPDPEPYHVLCENLQGAFERFQRSTGIEVPKDFRISTIETVLNRLKGKQRKDRQKDAEIGIRD